MDPQELIAMLVKGRGKAQPAPKIPLPRPDPREPDEYDTPDLLTPDQFARVYRRAPRTDTDMAFIIGEPNRIGGGRHQMLQEEGMPAIPESSPTNLSSTLEQFMKLYNLGAARKVDDPYSQMPSSEVNQEKMFEGARPRNQPPDSYDPDLTPQEFIKSLIRS
jgi:hypothetical protein